MSNPTFASWNYDGRNGSELAPNIARVLDRRWMADWQELRAIARQPRAPVEGIILLELRARWEERRRRVRPVALPPMLGEVGPWREGVGHWARHAIKRGRTHVEPLVYVRRDWQGWSAWWSPWRIDGLGDPPRGMNAPGEREIKAAVDAWLVGRRVRLG